MKVLVPDMPSADQILPYLLRMDQTRWYSNHGPLVRELETRLASEFKAQVCTVSSGTAGLELALHAMGLTSRTRARVLVPALTFSASRLAIERAGCTPVIADCGLELTPQWAENYIRLRPHTVDAIMPVCAYGRPQLGWDRLSDQRISIIIDAAAGFGNQPYDGIPCVFSMHATKAFGCGEGGFVVGDEKFVEKVKRLSNFGYVGSSGAGLERPIAGTNSKLSEYHGAVALAQLERWPEIMEKKARLRAHYAQHLQVLAPDVPSIFPVIVDNAMGAMARLKSVGIESKMWYYPLIGKAPETEPLAQRILCIPFHNFLTIEDASSVIRALDDSRDYQHEYAKIQAISHGLTACGFP